MVTRDEVLARFDRDEDALVRGVLHDLADSGLVFCSGSGAQTTYRAASDDELRYMRGARSGSGADELLWVVIYREGPIDRDQILARGGVRKEDLDACLQRLLDSDRIRREDDGRFSAREFFVGLADTVGWEAAVFDHYHALVKTICCKLSPDPELQLPPSAIGGSTYTFEVWPGHPCYDEVLRIVGDFRQAQSALRQRVEAYNAEQGLPRSYLEVTAYAGQCAVHKQNGS
jgi:hypothetical protein